MPNLEDTAANPQQLEVTSAAAWKSKQKRGVVVPLPSGNVVRAVRTMDLFALLKAGKIPNPLSKPIHEAMRSGGKKDFSPRDLEPEAYGQFLNLVDDAIPGIVVEPVVKAVPRYSKEDVEAGRCSELLIGTEVPRHERPDVEHLWVDDLDLEDRIYLYAFAQGGAADLESFREQSGLAVASASGGEDVSGAPVEPSGSGE